MRIVEVQTARVDSCIACGGTHEHIAIFEVAVQEGPGSYDFKKHEGFICPLRDYEFVAFLKDSVEPATPDARSTSLRAPLTTEVK